MSDHWIKLKEQSELLFYSDLDAYLIMTHIMYEATIKKTKYSRKKLKPGQALITNSAIRLSEQRWKDAKIRIEQDYKLATFKGTNKGSIATLTNTDFCDLNIRSENDQRNEPGTSQERTENEQGTTYPGESLTEQEQRTKNIDKQQQGVAAVFSKKSEKKKKALHTISDKIVATYDGWHFEEMPCEAPVEDISGNIPYIIRLTNISGQIYEVLNSIKNQLKEWGFSNNEIEDLKSQGSFEKIKHYIDYFQVVEFQDTPQQGMFGCIKQKTLYKIPDAIPFKEQVFSHFQNYEIYRPGYICYIKDAVIAFQATIGEMNPISVDLSKKGAKSKLYEILKKLRIENPFEKEEFAKELEEQFA